MKVLIIDVNCQYSSTGKIVYDLYDHLKNNSHEVRVCYGRGPIIKEPDIYKFSTNIEVNIHAALTRLTGLTGIYSPIATWKLLKLLEEFKPDVVHIHELHAYFVNIAPVINYLKQKNIKTIWTFHCEFMYTGKCGYAYECEKWKSECHKCPQVKEYPTSLYFDFTNKMFHMKKELFEGFDNLMIVTPSKWLADRVKQSFLHNKHIHVIHNGIETNKIFHPQKFDHLKIMHNITNEKVVLALAPDLMSERKGGKYVIEIAKRMKHEKIKFILIGLKDINEKFDDNIIPLGKIDNQILLSEYYSMADLFIICSKKENFPTTCIEALSCGTPVVGFDEGGTKETAPGGHGFFVEYGNVNELVEAIKLIFSDVITLENKEANAKFGEENYSRKKMAEDYLELYEELL